MRETRCSVQRQRMDYRSDTMDIERLDKATEEAKARWRDSLTATYRIDNAAASVLIVGL